MITLTVNGTEHSFDGDPEMPLLWYLRDELGLTGTKFGCGIAQCGACTIHLDGEPVHSCLAPAFRAQGRHVTTIEGLAGAEPLHPVQARFLAAQGFQCGFCTPGMIMQSIDVLNDNANPSEEEIRVAHCTLVRYAPAPVSPQVLLSISLFSYFSATTWMPLYVGYLSRPSDTGISRIT